MAKNPLLRKAPKMTGKGTGGHKSAGILDDFATRKVINTQEGKIEHTPTEANDIVNKAYVDNKDFGVPVGSTIPFAGSVVPVGYKLADGSAISRTTYSDLYVVIGTTYGVGDGSTTFNLPDGRGIFIRGAGANGTLSDANGDPFTATLGDYENDKFQGHTFGSSPTGILKSSASIDVTGTGIGVRLDIGTALTFQADGTNGTPRTGNETQPANLAMQHIIKAENVSVTVESVTSAIIADLTVTNSATFLCDITSTGFITGKKVGAFASLDAPTTITVVTAGVYYPQTGSTTFDPLESFELSPNGLKYKGTKTQYFEFDWHVTVKANIANTTIHVGVQKNTILDDNSLMAQFAKNANQEYTLSGTAVELLEFDDEIRAVLTSDGNGDVITLEHFTATVTEFFD